MYIKKLYNVWIQLDEYIAKNTIKYSRNWWQHICHIILMQQQQQSLAPTKYRTIGIPNSQQDIVPNVTTQ